MYFPMSNDLQKIVDDVLNRDNPYLATIGLNFSYLGTDKQSNVVQVTKANPLLKYIAKEDDDILFITIYEEAFDIMSEEYQKMVLRHAFDSIEFNSENGKITVKDKGVNITESVYLKYKEPAVLAVFSGNHAVRQIEEKKKESKKSSKK